MVRRRLSTSAKLAPGWQITCKSHMGQFSCWAFSMPEGTQRAQNWGQVPCLQRLELLGLSRFMFGDGSTPWQPAQSPACGRSSSGSCAATGSPCPQSSPPGCHCRCQAPPPSLPTDHRQEAQQAAYWGYRGRQLLTHSIWHPQTHPGLVDGHLGRDGLRDIESVEWHGAVAGSVQGIAGVQQVLVRCLGSSQPSRVG